MTNWQDDAHSWDVANILYPWLRDYFADFEKDTQLMAILDEIEQIFEAKEMTMVCLSDVIVAVVVVVVVAVVVMLLPMVMVTVVLLLLRLKLKLKL